MNATLQATRPLGEAVQLEHGVLVSGDSAITASGTSAVPVARIDSDTVAVQSPQGLVRFSSSTLDTNSNALQMTRGTLRFSPERGGAVLLFDNATVPTVGTVAQLTGSEVTTNSPLVRLSGTR